MSMGVLISLSRDMLESFLRCRILLIWTFNAYGTGILGSTILSQAHLDCPHCGLFFAGAKT